MPSRPVRTWGAPQVTAVGLDVGTTNAKAVLVGVTEGAASVLATARAPSPPPDRLADELRRLVSRVLAAVPAPPPSALGIASMAETGVPLDSAAAPLGPWLRWDGHRAAAEAADLAARLGAAELFAATGVRPAAKVPLATWAWLHARHPDTWAAMRRWAGVADLACLAVTGTLATDHTLAGRTMAYRLPAWPEPPPGAFDADLLAEVGLRPDRLPAVVGPDGVAGAVRDPGFVAAGLPAGTPVVVAGHDHAVGAYGAGVRLPGAVADSLGTAEAVYTVLAADPDRAAVAAAGMSLVRTATGRPALLAGSSSAGAMVEWWLRHEAPGSSAQDVFARAAAGLAGDDERPVVLPYVAGRQTPEPDPAARVRVVGRRPDHSPESLAAALVEGLVLQARWMLDTQLALAAGAGPAPDALVVLGGPAAANPTWMSVKARLSPLPVRVVDCAEPVGAGAALLALDRAGVLRPAPALSAVAVGAPDPAAAERALDCFVRAARTPDPEEVTR